MIDIVEWLASLAETAMVVGLCNRFLEFKNRRLYLLKTLGFFLCSGGGKHCGQSV